jgi:hypothetical protein
MTASPTGLPADIHPENPISAAAVSSSVLYNMLSAAGAMVNSDWFEFQPFSRCAIEVTGTGDTFSLQLVGSLSNESPTLSGVSGSNLGSAITENGITIANYPGIRWVQMQLSSIDSGAVTVDMAAVAP